MINPRIIQNNRKKLAVLVFSDIDGTINDERAPEKERLNTVAPAKKAIEQLQKNRIPVGLITARSFGETLIYKNVLKTEGIIISEDGAVLILPRLNDPDFKNLSKKNNLITYKKEKALILSKINTSKIKEYFKFINRILNEKSLNELITSCTSDPNLLMKLINYETFKDLERAIDRLASAYVRNSSPEQFELVKKYLTNYNLRIGGELHHFHIQGKDADKGLAIKFINNHIFEIFPENNFDGIFPIVLGNDYNDLRLFEEAHSMGGIGVIVKDSNGNFKVSEDKIPSYVLKSEGAFGHGMQEAIKIILKKLGD